MFRGTNHLTCLEKWFFWNNGITATALLLFLYLTLQLHSSLLLVVVITLKYQKILQLAEYSLICPSRFTIQNFHSPSVVAQPGQNGWIRPSGVAPQVDSAQWPSLPLSEGIRNPGYRPRFVAGGGYRTDAANPGFVNVPPPYGGPRPRFVRPVHGQVSAGSRTMVAAGNRAVAAPVRTLEKTRELRSQLLEVFPNDAKQISVLLQRYPADENIEKLSALLIGMLDDSC